MRRCLTIALGIAVLCGSAVAADDGALAAVRALTAAYNAHDVEAMLAHVTDDVEWHGIAGDVLSTETSGRDALREAMTGYFKSLPSARSEVEASVVSGSFVSVRERASWKASDGSERSQAALAVYEIRDGKVRRVWYFSAE